MSHQNPFEPSNIENNQKDEISSLKNRQKAQTEIILSNGLILKVNELESSFMKDKQQIEQHSQILNKVKSTVQLQLMEFTKQCEVIILNIERWKKQLKSSLNIIEESSETLNKFKTQQTVDDLELQYNKLFLFDFNQSEIMQEIKNSMPSEEDEYFDKLDIVQLDQISQDFSNQIGLLLELINQFKSENKNIQKYEMINFQAVCSYQMIQDCHIVTFNQESTLMLIGLYQLIKIYSFKEGQLNFIQLLYDAHTDHIMSLYFMKKKKNCFISGGRDNTIRIWIFDVVWKCTQIISVGEKKYDCFSLIMNKNEDVIISTTGDKLIQFLVQNEQQQWICQQKLPINGWNLDNLCLNAAENQLILTSGSETHLLEKDESKNWLEIQKFDFAPSSIVFLDDNTIIMQKYNTIDMYQKGEKGLFIIKDSLNFKVGNWNWIRNMKMQYNQKQSILLVKGLEYLNIIKIKANDVLVYDQYLFVSDSYQACLTNDGRFLIIFNNVTKQMQIKEVKGGIQQKCHQLQIQN